MTMKCKAATLMLAAASLIGTAFCGSAFAHDHTGKTGSSDAASVAPATDMSTATIRKVDASKRRLLLQHGPIPNLGMSGMTMGFEAAANVDLSGLNAGDTILFRAEQIKGQYTVTEIRKP